MDTLVKVSGLTKDFGPLKAVNNISLEVKRGEVLGFLGPNGAGKSTTMKMITGFLTATAGQITVAGFDIEQKPIEAKSRIGYLPEGAPAYGEMTPAQFLEFIADIRDMPRATRSARVTEVVAQIHLENVLHQRIETLSKGFKRRVGLAQAILHDPEILIMDEPTDGLDPNQKHEVRTLIKEMAAEKAIVISTHILEEVDAVCTRAVIINRGEVIFSGTPRELAQRSRYSNAATVVIGASDHPRVREELRTISGVQNIEEIADGDEVRITLIPANGENLATVVQERLTQIDCQTRGFFVEHGRLDEIFRTLTTEAADNGEVYRT